MLTHLPSGWVDSDGIRFARYVSDQASAIWSLKLAHIYGITQFSPVGCVIAEPVHPRVIRPINVARDPVGGEIPGAAEVRALQPKTAAKSRQETAEWMRVYIEVAGFIYSTYNVFEVGFTLTSF